MIILTDGGTDTVSIQQVEMLMREVWSTGSIRPTFILGDGSQVRLTLEERLLDLRASIADFKKAEACAREAESRLETLRPRQRTGCATPLRHKPAQVLVHARRARSALPPRFAFYQGAF